MAVTTAPSIEAMQAIVDQINSGTGYDLDFVAGYSEQVIDPLEELQQLRVDVTSETEQQLVETLDIEDRSTHGLRVWIRKKVDIHNPDEITALKLLTRKLFQRLNNFDSADRRVRVWEADIAGQQVPDKEILREHQLFVAAISLRVEVEASA